MTATAGGLHVRVWVTDVWDAVTLAARSDETVGQVKARALAAATGRAAAHGDHAVKFRGALVTDERQTLAQLRVVDGAPLIVLPARRRPVR